MALSLSVCDHYYNNTDVKRLAVAVSGGPDSMALLHALSSWAVQNDVTLYALTVDHGLRPAAAEEAKQVAQCCAELSSNIHHHILVWGHEDKPENRIQEAARKARYALMAEFCHAHDIPCLAIAHHQDDQAETVLMRLSAGSGLSGLAGMRPAIKFNDDLTVLRPFLDHAKADLITYCTDNNVPYVNDPSNVNDRFERVRLRQSWDVLAAEGLSSKRLSVTARRIARGVDALEHYAQDFWDNNVTADNNGVISMPANAVNDAPVETILRVIIMALRSVGHDKDYLPRMEKIEDLLHDLCRGGAFRKRTLGGAIFECDAKRNKIIITAE